jgi:predicted O-methyltransferase YrrM
VMTSLTENEGRRLAELADGKVVLELGAWQGASTIWMAQTAEVVHSVDHHKGDEHAGCGWTLPHYLRNLDRYGLGGKVVIHMGTFDQVLPYLAPFSFDVVFLDGFHTYEQVTADLALCSDVLEPDGTLAVHDYTRDGMQSGGVEFGVKKAVDERHGRDPDELVDSLAIFHV